MTFLEEIKLRLKEKGPSTSVKPTYDDSPKVMVSTFLAVIKNKLLGTGEAHFNVKVRPNASISQIKEVTADGVLRLDLKAKPIQGQANEELIRLLAKELAIPQESIRILAGKSSREKLIKITQ